jgi:hypothetical protein
MRLHRIAAGALLLASILANGCGGPVNVEGKILWAGKPLAGAQVLFIPVAGGQQAGDVTDAEGHFRLQNPKTMGIVPGEYLVTVSKKDYPPGMKRPDLHEMSLALSAKMRQLLPNKYTLQDHTPLRVKVPRGGTQDVVLEIE